MESAFKPSVFLAIVDLIPVFVFLAGAAYLMKFSYKKIMTVYFAAMAGGCALVFFGGFYKALWKLIYSIFDYNIRAMDLSQFLFVAPGFLLIFIASTSLVKNKNQEVLYAAGAMTMDGYKIPLVMIMALSNLGYLICMIIAAFKIKCRLSIFFYILSIIAMLSMAGLSSAPKTEVFNWIEQCVNISVQAFAFLGHLLLYKKDIKLKTL